MTKITIERETLQAALDALEVLNLAEDQVVDGRYEINDDHNAQQQRELSQAAALLRRHGWNVKEPAHHTGGVKA